MKTTEDSKLEGTYLEMTISLNSKRKQRLKLIYDLHTQGWSNKKISDHLNSKNLKTPRTRKEFTPKLIWMTIHRYQKRLTRKSNRILRIKESINISLPKEFLN